MRATADVEPIYLDGLVRSVGISWDRLSHTPSGLEPGDGVTVETGFVLDVQGVPVRGVRSRRKRTTTGRYPSRKLRRMVDCEGFWETRLAPFLELDTSIRAYLEQPTTISFVSEGKNRTYTPDFLVEYRTAALEVIEVKPSSKLRKTEDLDFFAAIAASLAARGAGFRLVTDYDLRAKPLAQNISLLEYFGRDELSADAMAAHVRARDHGDRSALEALSLADWLGLVARGFIRTPLNLEALTAG